MAIKLQKLDSQIPGIRGSSTNSGANENSMALVNDAVFATIQDVESDPKSLEEA